MTPADCGKVFMTNRKEITRQSLMNDDVRTWHERYGALMDVVTPSYFKEILDYALVTAPPSGDVWVFAYGSLIWNPAIEFAETRVGQLFGYSKKFCLKSLIGRGTPDRPGLMLGLVPGGSCVGLGFRLPEKSFRDELELLFRREIMSGAYIPKWCNVHTTGGVVVALTFVMDTSSNRYAGGLSEEAVARILATAEGSLGPNREYLAKTIDSLLMNGLHDSRLEKLLRRVDLVGTN